MREPRIDLDRSERWPESSDGRLGPARRPRQAGGVEDRELLRRIGVRVRRHRTDQHLTIKAVAERSGLSPRYLSDVESGRANISVGRLSELARALGVSLVSLVRPPASGIREAIESLLAEATDAELGRLLAFLQAARGHRHRAVVALLGVRGAGKSTVGVGLAAALGLPFVELVSRVENRAGMPLSDIFTLHGEAYYRKLELECLAQLLASAEPCVVAMPGGIVGNGSALEMIKETCRSVWLRGLPEDYWTRVFAQGDRRPMAGRRHAMAELRKLVARREPLYRQADYVVDTSQRSVDAVVAGVLAELSGPDEPTDLRQESLLEPAGREDQDHN